MTRPASRTLALGALVLAAIALSSCPGRERTSTDGGTGSPTDDGEDGDGRVVELFFPGYDGRLHRETRRIAAGIEGTEAVVAAVVAAVIEGPRGERLHAPLPQLAAMLEDAPPRDDAGDDEASDDETGGDTTGDPDAQPSGDDNGDSDERGDGGDPAPPTAPKPTLGVFLIEDTVYLDLPAPASPPAVGARQELLMLYSLVNSVLANAPDASRVVVLWDGEQPLTFAGHIDTGRPLMSQHALVAKNGAKNGAESGAE